MCFFQHLSFNTDSLRPLFNTVVFFFIDENEKKKETSTSSLTKFLQSIKSGKGDHQDEG